MTKQDRSGSSRNMSLFHCQSQRLTLACCFNLGWQESACLILWGGFKNALEQMEERRDSSFRLLEQKQVWTDNSTQNSEDTSCKDHFCDDRKTSGRNPNNWEKIKQDWAADEIRRIRPVLTKAFEETTFLSILCFFTFLTALAHKAERILTLQVGGLCPTVSPMTYFSFSSDLKGHMCKINRSCEKKEPLKRDLSWWVKETVSRNVQIFMSASESRFLNLWSGLCLCNHIQTLCCS